MVFELCTSVHVAMPHRCRRADGAADIHSHQSFISCAKLEEVLPVRVGDEVPTDAIHDAFGSKLGKLPTLEGETSSLRKRLGDPESVCQRSKSWIIAYVNAWRASLGTLVGRDWMAGVVDLLAMIVSKRRSSSWHLIRMPFLGCVLVVASCSTHIASEAAPALLVRSGSIRTRGCRSDLRRQCGCHQCGPPQRQIRHQGRRPTKALI